MSAVSMPIPITLASSRTIACGPVSGARSSRSAPKAEQKQIRVRRVGPLATGRHHRAAGLEERLHGLEFRRRDDRRHCHLNHVGFGFALTYGEFERYTNRVAAALLASGVKKGERVAYFGKNSDRYLEIFFGAAKVGAVTTPINWRLAGPELAYILQDSRAPILFVGERGTSDFDPSTDIRQSQNLS